MIKGIPYTFEKEKQIKLSEGEQLDIKRILKNAIKMQALYSKGKVRFIETSQLAN